jgi:hypothetical protein
MQKDMGQSGLGRRTFLRSAAAGLAVTTTVAARAHALAPAVTVRRAGAARPLTPTFFGVNGNNTRGRVPWDRADLGTALASLRPGTIRYPAGTIGNYWDWRRGWFQPNGPWQGQTVGGQEIVPFDNSLTPYGVALSRCGAEPTFMLNLHTFEGRVASATDSQRMLQDQIQFLRQAESLGIPVTRIELGNEFYLSAANAPDYTQRFPTAAAYAVEASSWASALRSAFPAAQIAAVATNATGTNSARREGWNAGLLSALSGVDVVTMHPYISLFPPDASSTPQSLLSLPYTRSRSLATEEFQQLAGRGFGVWITEFNMIDQTPGHGFAGTWTHGLVVAAYAMLLAQQPIVTMLQLHNVVGDSVVGALFDSTSGFGSPSPATELLGRSAVGSTYATLLAASSSSTTGRRLAFTGGPVLAGGAPGLVGMDFANGSQHQAVVVNLSSSAVSLSLGNLFTGAVSWTRTSAPALTTRVTGSSALTVTNGSASGSLNVPRHSLVRLRQP